MIKKVLSELAFGEKESGEQLPRIWWIGSGFASSLPFHVAGKHRKGSRSTLVETVVSSYVPTIRALIHSKSRALAYDAQSSRSCRLLMATMATTPDTTEPLNGVPEEAKAIRANLNDNIQIAEMEQPDVQTVLGLMPGYELFHFAGHGMSNLSDPTRSYLVFQKPHQTSAAPIQDQLTVGQILDMDIQPALLAFLSACSTAENQNSRLADESIHLASGFLVAGFRRVVASLWPSSDGVCRDVASGFYGHLPLAQGGAIKDDDFARALHLSIRQIYGRLREYPLLWAQYVHMGA